MIPVDCIRLIIDYVQLNQRFRWSLVHREFRFQAEDWSYWSKHYQIKDRTRQGVKELVQGHFDAQHLFSSRERHLWSSHLCAPLKIWSPWTLKKCCTKYTTGCKMSFRNFAFIDFVNNILNKFGLKSRYLSSGQAIIVNIWKKKIPMVYIHKQRRVRKLHISSAFKSFYLARVFVTFRLHEQRLFLHPQRLEFLV